MKTIFFKMLTIGSLYLLPLYPSHETSQSTAILLESYKIWDAAPHNAFTDLVRYKDKWFCVFRESDFHVKGQNGKIRIIESPDGTQTHWESTILIEDPHYDLRDPKLSVTPNNQLMLLVGGSVYSPEGNYITKRSHVAFSRDGKNWSSFTPILEEQEWLWRVTWYQGIAYGVSYNSLGTEWTAKLFKSSDGIHYDLITQLPITGHPSEATLQFDESEEMFVLIRRGGQPDNHAWLGKSLAPYTEWKWLPTPFFVGGPNFVITPHHSFWAGGRIFEDITLTEENRTGVFELMRNEPNVLYLPSGGKDSGYPGMVFYKDVLWVSYYSSHEGKAAIYLAKIKVD